MENAVMEKNNETLDKNTEGNLSKDFHREEALREFIPAADVYESDERFTLYLDLPGVKEEDLSIELERSVLIVKGEFTIGEEEKKDGYREFHKKGRYVRSFNIKAEIDRDHIEAGLKNGVLKLVLPRIEPEIKKIQVNAG